MRSFPGYLQIRDQLGGPNTELSVLVSPLGSHSVLELKLFGKKKKQTFSFQGEIGSLLRHMDMKRTERDGVMIDAAKKVNKFGIEQYSAGVLCLSITFLSVCVLASFPP